ncbi:MAG: IclR family transcriptional regulator, partial [Solimonas sp.]
MLVTLAGGGLLVKDDRTNLFALSPLIASLGRRAQGSGRLMQIARPLLQRLAEESGETASLAMLQGDRWVYLDGVESAQAIRLTLTPGEVFPLHAGCVGKVLLAYQTDAFVEALLGRTPLEQCTPNTITDPALLRRAIAEIREQGVGFSDSETTPGVRSVCAPVFDSDGRTMVCLVLSGPS